MVVMATEVPPGPSSRGVRTDNASRGPSGPPLAGQRTPNIRPRGQRFPAHALGYDRSERWQYEHVRDLARFSVPHVGHAIISGTSVGPDTVGGGGRTVVAV